MRIAWALAVWLAISPAFAWTHGTQVPPGNWAIVNTDPATPGATIPSTFVGLSWNKGPGGSTYGYFNPTNSQLISIFKTLGTSGGFRVGGTPCAISEAAATPQADIQNMHDFLVAVGSGWTNNVIWCLNAAPGLGANDIAFGLAEVGYFEAAFGPGVVTYVIGNEPDLYYGSLAAYESDFNAFYTAIHAVYPAAKFSGPDVASSFTAGAGWVSGFAADEAGKIAFTTEHFYTGGTNNWTVANLLYYFPVAIGQPPNSSPISKNVPAVAPLKMVLDETSTIVTAGGTPGVSNAAISASWIVDLAITLASAGWAGFDTENVCFSVNTYAQINGTGDCHPPGPTWYVTAGWAGMLLASNIQGSRLLIANTTNGGSNIGVLATLTAAGKVAYLIANLDSVNPVSVIPQSKAGWSSATVTTIGSASPSDLTININGVVMTSVGACSAACPPSTISRGEWFTIPAGGAAYAVLN